MAAMELLNTKEEEQKEEKAVESNCFSKPWKNSDVALVVEGVELHVHRAILCFQSPVFEAMLNGDFKEAKQDKIPLKGKDPNDMINFLKLLYPSKTFDSSLNKPKLAAILALADEYQAEAVIKQCFDETRITPANALTILHYACERDQSIRQKCINLAQKQIKCQNLKENTSDLLDQSLREEILTGKCELLEETMVKANKKLVSCMWKLDQLQLDKFAGKAVCCLSHEVKLREFYKARKCEACLVAYRKIFCDSITRNGSANSWSTELFELLEEMDDLLTQKTKRD